MRALIHDCNNTGRVLIIRNGLYGPGPYSKTLAGLDQRRTGKGRFSPVMAHWFVHAIQQITERVKGPMRMAETKLGLLSTFTITQ